MNSTYNDETISTAYKFSKMSDEELVRRCGRSCSDPAWGEFTRRFDRLIRHYVRRVWSQYQKQGDSKLACEVQDDLTQEVYLKLFKDGMQSLREFRGLTQNSFPAFLWRICFNAVTSYYRKTIACKRRGWVISTEELELDESSGSGGRALLGCYLSYNPESEIVERILAGEMRKYLKAFTKGKEAQVLESYLQDKKIREMALRFGLSKGTMDTLFKRACNILRTRMSRPTHCTQSHRTAA